MAASKVKIYIDESVHVAIAKGLKRRGILAWSANDVGNLGLSDEEQLEYANREKAIILSHDVDFLRLAQMWWHQGKEHWGVIYAYRHKLSIGQLISRLVEIAEFFEAEDFKNRVEYL